MTVGVVLIVVVCMGCLWYFFRNVEEKEEAKKKWDVFKPTTPGTSVTKVRQMNSRDFENNVYP